MITVVDEDNLRVMIFGFVGINLAIAHDDDMVINLYLAGSSAV